MVSEFLERNESGQKTFSGRKFVKPRLHYGDPIVPPGHCDAPPPVIASGEARSKPAASIVIATHHPPSLRRATPVIAIRPHCHCEQRSCEANQPRPSSLRRTTPRHCERRSAKQTLPRPSSLRRTTPRHCEQRSCEANQPRPSSLRAAKLRSKPCL